MARTLVITTGGTIGALPVESIENMPHIKDMPPDSDMVKEALKTEFSGWETRCVSLEPRDSNFIDQLYREHIAQLIEESAERRIIITHGTDTILETTQFFYERTKAYPDRYEDKAIIVTGAMVPLANGHFSDGFRNIEFSFQQLSSTTVPSLSVVLFGYDVLGTRKGEWRPRLYPFVPGKYQRYYDRTDPTKDGLAPYGYPHGREPQNHCAP